MAVHLSVLLIFSGLTGIGSITTVSKVSVKAGGSISIPCLYESKYTHHVKYLCEGTDWVSCSNKVKTNQPRSPGQFSISDDTRQRILTVTIDDLSDHNTHNWCSVDIKDLPDDGKYFQLSVTTGCPLLFVDRQEMTAFKGEDVTIDCRQSISGESQWCMLGGACVKPPSGWIDRMRVTVDTKHPDVFTVTMRGLREESSGWYYCAKGNLQMPVHVTVKERPSTAARRVTTLSPTPTPGPVNPTSVSAYQSTTAQASYHSVSLYTVCLLPVTLLIFIVLLASFVWRTLKPREQTKASSAVTAAEEEVTYSVVCIVNKWDKPGTASSAHTHMNQVKATHESVTYSTLHYH